jgi:hypothetical protein
MLAELRGERVARWDDRLQLATFASRIVLKAVAGRSTERERRQVAALRLARRAKPRLEPL